jgi:3-hydroxybutyrate dehydrogenase
LLNGKCALVTGSTAGLGYAIAESLARSEAHVVLHGLEDATAARDSIKGRFGVEAASVVADLTKPPEIERMVESVFARFGGIDILVNNAVVRHFAPVESFPPERWEEALAVNLSAPFHLIRLTLPAMIQRGWGRIVNMASIYSTRAVQNRIDYVTTKTGLLGMTRTVALETAKTGVTCNALCPGTVPSPAIEARIASIAMSQGISAEEATQRYLAERQPSARFVSMENVGSMVMFLCSPAGQDVTGATLPIDGGWSAA